MAEAAAVAQPLAASAAPAEGLEDPQGLLPLTPIQHWFFESGLRTPSHWNQAVLLQLRRPIEPEVLQRGLQLLVERHAALRTRFVRDAAGAWHQQVAEGDSADFFERVDVSEVPSERLASTLEAHGTALQARLDIERGPLLRAAWFACGSAEAPRLLVAIHHLAVDGVSWRVLLDELQTVCAQLAQGEPPTLPPVGSSYALWARRLQGDAASPRTRDELAYWSQLGDAGALPQRGDLADATVGEARRVRATLDATRTAALLSDVPARLRAGIEEVMLTALALTLCAWSGHAAVLVELEGHGREDLFDELDLSRTVGWFTSRFPVRLAPGGSGGLAALKQVKEQLRGRPRKGVGYGVLRHLGDPATRERLAGLAQPQVCFNYLGRFDRVFHETSPFTLAAESPGATRHPGERRTHALDIDGQVLDGVLSLEWTYSPSLHDAREIEGLAADFVQRLAALVDALQASEAGVTPSDFPLARLSQAELDALPVAWRDVVDVYPLAPMQHGLLLHTLLNPGAGMYLMQDRYRLSGELDPGAFQRAWQRVVQRHAALRTAFFWRNEDRPLQLVYREAPPVVSCLDWSGLPESVQREQLDTLLADELRQGFDLGEPRLIRFRLIRLGGDRWYFTQSYHHIVLDAWCFSLLMVDFFAHYQAECEGREAQLPQPRAYADFIAWLEAQDPSAARDYWRRTLEGVDELTPLMIDKATERREHGGVEDRQVQLDEAETAALQSEAQRHRLTVNTYTQGAWALLLAWYAGRREVVFGTTVAGRPTELEGIESSVGLFINTLPLRLPVPAGQRVTDWLHEVLRRNVEMRHHEHLPLPEVQALSPLGRGKSLFDSLFVFENAPVDRSLDEWKLRWRVDEKTARTHTNYPLTVVVIPGERLTLQLTYDRQLFEREAVDRMLAHFKGLLLTLLRHPGSRLAELPRLGEAERLQLAGWNDSGDGDGIPEHYGELFERQAAATPDAIAARCGDAAVDYAELNRRANRIAHRLIAMGIGPDDVVALYDRRGIDLLACIVAVFKAGAAYLPLDPDHPPARLAQVLRLSRAAAVWSGAGDTARLDTALRDLGAEAPPRVVMPGGGPADESHPVPRGRGDNLAYIIYTSGSTGVPKGAMVHRRGMLNTLLQKHVQLGLTRDDVVAQTASACFDISVWQFLSGLLCGATVEIVPDDVVQDPAALRARLVQRRVTVLECVPAMLRALLAEPDDPGLPLALRWLLPTGEALPPELARHWLQRFPQVPLLNVYGPAECADDVALHALHEVQEASGAQLPIGRPVRHLRLHVVNRDLEPLPPGVPGELCIAGVGVGRGYLHDPVRTATAFVPNPFAEVPGERLYRSGDLVRQRPDGVCEYLGRLDHQVKLRGFRIELGEIEARLRAVAGVEQAVALVREDRPGDQRLVAYVVPGTLEPAELKAALTESLPAYMVPAAIVALDRLPHNANGKIDRRSLPAPEWHGEALEDERPATALQQRLASIWAEVLGLPEVGVTRDFFALGGHSLLATQLVSRVRRQLGVELPLRAVFDAPTVAALAETIERCDTPDEAAPLVAAAGRGDTVPLSFGQQRLWFLAQLEEGASAVYNMPVVLKLQGALDVPAMEAALYAIQARHEVLRSVIVEHEGQAQQRVLAPQPVSLAVDSLSDLPPADREAAARERAAAEAARPFVLDQELPWRARLLRLDKEVHWLLLTLHHIAGDGWSLGLWMQELAAGYAAACAGRPPVAEPLPLQYADYALWQRQWLAGPVRQRQLDYWREALGDPNVVLELPSDRSRPPLASHRGASLDFELEPALVARLRQVGQRHGTTLFASLLAGFAVLLHRYSGQRDLRIGTPVANRHRLETEGLIGLFVNTLVMRCRVEPELDFGSLLRQVRETTLGAQAHQDLPFEQLVEALLPERDLSRSPLFQVMFILNPAPAAQQTLPGLTVEALAAEHRTAKFDLSLIANEREDGGVSASFEYSTDLFDPGTVERLARHLRTLLQVAATSAAPVADWPLLDARERRQLLHDWNGVEDLRTPLCVAAAFEAQARQRPTAPALICGDEVLSYAELDRRAETLAQQLRSAGVGADTLVGICLQRSAWLPVALLAVLKAGGAYLPLDPAYPAERLAWMLQDAKPALLLTHTALRAVLPPTEAALLCLDAPQPLPQAVGGRVALPDHLAYTIYTSGSTGRPKGVQVTRAGLGNLLRSMQRQLDFGADETLLAVTSLSFDIAALELYLPLVYGGTVLLADTAQAADAGELMRLLREHPVTTMQATPATWRLLLDAGWQGAPQGLRLLCGGEAMPADLAGALVSRCDALWNVYGPTETTVWSTLQGVGETTAGMPPIGRPLDNTELCILDARMEPVPLGAVGELYIGGIGLARGYHGRGDLSAERFVPHPFVEGRRLYRTGDLARWRADGTVLCLGRADRQVKLRGFRIELDEIESALSSLPGVRQAAVTVVGEADKQLVAYVVPEAPQSVDAAGLRLALSSRLPGYMVPGRWVLLDALPLTPNGKVDRKALPVPLGAGAGAGTYVAPGTPMEALIASTWEEHLGVEAVGTGDNFFELGGHSLLAVRVMQRLRQLLEREVPLTLLFQAPTVAALAAALQRQGPATPGGSPLIALRREGELPPLFCVHPAGGHVAAYLPLVKALGPQQPVYGLQSRALFDPSWRDPSIAAMARDYVAAIRQVQAHGPYRLLGWSMGGMIAQAMAAELEREGETVAFVALLDTTLYTDVTLAERHDLADEYLDQFEGLLRGGLAADTRAALYRELIALEPADQLAHLARWAEAGQRLEIDRLDEIRLQVQVRDSANRLMRENRVQPVHAPLYLWCAQQTLDRHAAVNADWAAHTRGGLHRFSVPGDHWEVVASSAVHRGLAALLRGEPVPA
ncbi:amino acid adenylation domain-containing protein [Aquabacterium sp. A7-Y]|uniref:amino acid adenylation domain-containing protein n=1 Tax=Aquabacterium sp. A7-Y TaxID=1349605 RepID=UPI0039FC8127